jgi:hypothetical protein
VGLIEDIHVTLRSSLNRHLDWASVLDALAADRDDTPFLPARAACPLCYSARKLQVMQDPLLGGAWYRCVACDFAGDAIELAAAAWGVSPKLAARKLLGGEPPPGTEATLDEQLAAYLKRVLAVRRRAAAFWESCRVPGPVIIEPGTEDVLAAMGVPGTCDGASWRDRGGRFVGFSTRTLAEEYLSPTAARTQRLIGANRTHLRTLTFRGPSWKGLVVVPYEDLPGRIAGFLFVGREARPQDRIYRSVFPANPARCRNLHAAMLGTSAAGTPVLVMPEIGDALRLQLRRVSDGSPPLPIVSPRLEGAARGAWPYPFKRRYVVWDPRDPVRAVAVAGLCGGEISVNAPHTKSVKDYIVNQTADAVYDGCRAMRKSRDAFVERLASEAPEAVEELAADGVLSRSDLADLAARCGERESEVISGLLDGPSAAKSVLVNQREYREEGGRWLANGRVVCDFVIRVDRVIYQESRGRGLFEGRVIHAGREIPFLAPADAIEPDPLRWARNEIWKAGAGAPIISPRHSRDIMQVAWAMQKPAFASGVDRVGWHPARRQMIMPRFAIDDGRVEPCDLLTRLAEGPLPCADFEPPDVPTEFEFRYLSRVCDETAVFWGVAAYVVAAALAPALGYEMPSLAFAGRGAAAFVPAAAKACGCVALPGDAGTLDAQLGRHDWPALVAGDGRPKPGPLAGRRGVIARATAAGALSLRLGHGWRMLTCNSRGLTRPLDVPGGATVLPAYLKDVIGRAFRQYQGEKSYWATGSLLTQADVARDLMRWWAKAGGNPAAVSRGLARLSPSRDDAGVAFVALLGRLDPSLAEAEGDRVFVPAAALNRAIEDAGGVPLDYQITTGKLARAGALAAGPEGKRDGWHLASAWLEARRRQGDKPAVSRRTR